MGLYEAETCSYPSTNTSKCLHHSTQISVKVLYRCSIQPQARILWQFCKKPAMFIDSGVQTFREPFAALSRSFATAAKTYIHMCTCHSDTKSLAWVLERLPYIYIYIYTQFPFRAAQMGPAAPIGSVTVFCPCLANFRPVNFCLGNSLVATVRDWLLFWCFQ